MAGEGASQVVVAAILAQNSTLKASKMHVAVDAHALAEDPHETGHVSALERALEALDSPISP